jgi:hypothetical protein
MKLIARRMKVINTDDTTAMGMVVAVDSIAKNVVHACSGWKMVERLFPSFLRRSILYLSQYKTTD